MPSVVAIGMVRELGPVLAGLMVTGRVASSIAAEIGTMRVTEQIDALSTLSTDPMKYLVLPRVLAAFIALPLLVAVANVIGIMGGYLIAVQTLGFNPATYIRNTLDYVGRADISRAWSRPRPSKAIRARPDGLLPRLSLGARRARRRPGDDKRGRLGLDPDPRGELRADPGVLLMTPKIEFVDVHKGFNGAAVLTGVSPSRSCPARASSSSEPRAAASPSR